MKKINRIILLMGLLAIISGCGGGGSGGGGKLGIPVPVPVCGNGAVEISEQCDDGNTTTELCVYGESICTICNSECKSVIGIPLFCGNGVIDTGEQCDDGNSVTETCEYGEQSCEVCDSSCKSVPGSTSYCGDGDIDFLNNEMCEDGNTVSNDGCSSDCKVDVITFSKTYGGTGWENYVSIKQTSDDGFVVLGSTDSLGAGEDDFEVIKIDKLGNKEWSNTYGGVKTEQPGEIQQTADGGYIAVGYISSPEIMSTQWSNCWIIKINSGGTQEWSSTKSSCHGLVSVKQTAEGGYITAGFSQTLYSFNYILVKFDANGKFEWSKSDGGADDDRIYSIQLTSDDQYIGAGYTRSYGSGGADMFVVKMDTSGKKIWSKTFGGSSNDMAESIQLMTDGGHIVAGYTESLGAGGSDFFIVKIDSDGNEVWSKTYGASFDDRAIEIGETTDGGFIVVGTTYSYGAGSSDFWVLKLDSNGDCPGCVFE